jgi:hypothetical protein
MAASKKGDHMRRLLAGLVTLALPASMITVAFTAPAATAAADQDSCKVLTGNLATQKGKVKGCSSLGTATKGKTSGLSPLHVAWNNGGGTTDFSTTIAAPNPDEPDPNGACPVNEVHVTGTVTASTNNSISAGNTLGSQDGNGAVRPFVDVCVDANQNVSLERNTNIVLVGS